MPSSKMTTTCDRPNFEIDRSFSRPGSPAMACSIGNVSCRSTSSGLSDGATVLICTITGVVSGNASTLRNCSENAPATITASTATRTTARFRSEKSISQLSMAICPKCGTGIPIRVVEVVTRQWRSDRPVAGHSQVQPAPRLFFSSWALSTSLPTVAMTSPGRTPAMISVASSVFAPTRTDRV